MMLYSDEHWDLFLNWLPCIFRNQKSILNSCAPFKKYHHSIGILNSFKDLAITDSFDSQLFRGVFVSINKGINYYFSLPIFISIIYTSYLC